MPKRLPRRILILLGFLAGGVVVVSAIAGLAGGAPWMALAAKGLALGAALLLGLWVIARLLQRLLWRVGRRLAFSYLLIGVLPIPMAGLLLLLNAYLIAGYFTGHLYRDAVDHLHDELEVAAAARAAHLSGGLSRVAAAEGDLVFAYYRAGARVAGDPRLPERWPDWLEAGDGDPGEGDSGATPPGRTGRSFVAWNEGAPTLAAAVRNGDAGVVAVYAGDVEDDLSRRAEVWVSLIRSDDPRRESTVRLRVLAHEFALQPLIAKRRLADRAQFFGEETETAGILDRPLLWWGEVSRPYRDLADGSAVAEFVTASLNGTLRTVFRNILSGAAEVNTAVWAGLISLTVLLSTIYALAAAMAIYLIVTLSRAVDRLSHATAAVQSGDFSARIPVRRRDQVGELQHSFNSMTANLEQLVASQAHKEILEKELEIARKLQKSLLPSILPSSDVVDFATLFEPSAAIGGDYFDILRIDDQRLAVVIADVSGHGLPTGLRMAMLKAALVILVEESKRPEEILRRLSEMVRADAGDRRTFVTATVAVVDFRQGRLELTNAGHPPTYLVRSTGVEEILLPGNPLGALGETYGETAVELATGDVAVWLSDGLIEAVGRGGEPFGYDRVREALAGPAPSAAIVRDRLLAAVDRHVEGSPPHDDRTLVAMRYLAGRDSSPRLDITRRM